MGLSNETSEYTVGAGRGEGLHLLDVEGSDSRGNQMMGGGKQSHQRYGHKSKDHIT